MNAKNKETIYYVKVVSLFLVFSYYNLLLFKFSFIVWYVQDVNLRYQILNKNRATIFQLSDH